MHHSTLAWFFRPNCSSEAPALTPTVGGVQVHQPALQRTTVGLVPCRTYQRAHGQKNQTETPSTTESSVSPVRPPQRLSSLPPRTATLAADRTTSEGRKKDGSRRWVSSSVSARCRQGAPLTVNAAEAELVIGPGGSYCSLGTVCVCVCVCVCVTWRGWGLFIAQSG